MSTDKTRSFEIELKEGYMKKIDPETWYFMVAHAVGHKIGNHGYLLKNLSLKKQNIEFPT